MMEIKFPEFPPKNTLLCEYKFYEKIIEFKSVICESFRVENGSAIKVVATPYCDSNRAYLIDSNGTIHTLIIKEGAQASA